MNWYLVVLKKYAVFSGRARRKECWMFYLFNIIIVFVLRLIEALASGPDFFELLYLLAVLIPGLAVSVRRLHDTNRSGWWLLIGLVPAILYSVLIALMFMAQVNLTGWLLFISLVTLVGGIVVLVFLVKDSQPGENQYGPNPKDTTA